MRSDSYTCAGKAGAMFDRTFVNKIGQPHDRAIRDACIIEPCGIAHSAGSSIHNKSRAEGSAQPNRIGISRGIAIHALVRPVLAVGLRRPKATSGDANEGMSMQSQNALYSAREVDAELLRGRSWRARSTQSAHLG